MKRTLLTVVMLGALGAGSAAVTADGLIEKIDLVRGIGNSFTSLVEITNLKGDTIIDTNTLKVLYKMGGDHSNRSIAVFTMPENMRGRKLLLVGINTWLYIPGAEKPLRISLAQKLTGGVSTGDILSVNYRSDYNAKLIGTDKVGNTPVHKLELTANKKGVTYFKIVFFVSQESLLPVTADFYSKSDVILKRAYYKKFEPLHGRTVCTQLLIKDMVFPDKLTVVKYTKFEKENVSESYFNSNILKDLKL